ncbi:MAG TPA: hypothetical protein VLC93_03980 [Myxococcota bacterium]|nr:hypothetical protein [Myxococcota bacterium]
MSHDVYVIAGSTRIDDEDDCKSFVRFFEDQFAALGHKVDVIFVPGEFIIEPAMVEPWGRARQEVFDRFFGLSIRVVSDYDFSIDQATKAIKRKEVVSSAPDIETALVLIAHMRAQQSESDATA